MDDILFLFFRQPGTLAIVATTTLLVIAEVGYRQGLRLFTAGDPARRSQIGAVQAAVLGLLALLLGFTFSMAADRYEDRRELVIQQANTIGTAWLRGGLLPDAHRQPVRDLLGAYVDLQARAHDALRDPALMAAALRRTAEIRSALWRHAEASGREAPNDMTATFVETLNDMIDTEAARVTASANRIPPGVWLLLVVVAAVGCWTSGYGAGADGVRSTLTSVLLPLLVTVVMLLILDLTNERRGIISVSQQPLVDVQESIGSASLHGQRRSGR
jgi:hypothetical protein